MGSGIFCLIEPFVFMITQALMKTAKRFLGTLDCNVDRCIKIIVTLGNDNGIFTCHIDGELDTHPFFTFIHAGNGIDADNVEMKFRESIDRMH
jgi:hypothetical protein